MNKIIIKYISILLLSFPKRIIDIIEQQVGSDNMKNSVYNYNKNKKKGINSLIVKIFFFEYRLKI